MYPHVILRHEYSHDFSKVIQENTVNTNLEVENSSSDNIVASFNEDNSFNKSLESEPYLSEYEEKVVNFRINANLSLNRFVELLHLLKDPRASTVRVSRKAAIRMGVEFHSDINVPILLNKTFSYRSQSGNFSNIN